MLLHRIRLRGPWECEAVARTRLTEDGSVVVEPGALPPPGRLWAPDDWGTLLGADFRGRVRLRRNFHRPTGVEKNNRLFLAIDGVDPPGRAWLNGELLGPVGEPGVSARFEVTGRLLLRNVLLVEVDLPRLAAGQQIRRNGPQSSPGGLRGEIALEIEGD